ncbi:MAG: hypothetical protein R3Y21_02795 [Mycoplasmatota bacterium]
MKNKKGFLLIEVLIASIFIVITLTFLYNQFQLVNSSFQNSLSYNLAKNIYKNANIINYLNENAESVENLKLDVDANGYSEIFDGISCLGDYNNTYCNNLMSELDAIKVYAINYDITSFIDISSNLDMSNKFINFVKTMENVDGSGYILIAEFEGEQFSSLDFNLKLPAEQFEIVEPVGLVSVGDYVTYEAGGLDTFRILHEDINGEIQIVSNTVGHEYTIDADDNTFYYSVRLLNDQAELYLDTTLASSARILGSDPADPSFNESSTKLNSSSHYIGYNDTCYLSDYNSLLSMGNYYISSVWLGARKGSGSNCLESSWQSRGLLTLTIDISGPTLTITKLNYVQGYCGYVDYGLSSPVTRGIVPVISLKSTTKIAGGDGTIDSPYILVATESETVE